MEIEVDFNLNVCMQMVTLIKEIKCILFAAALVSYEKAMRKAQISHDNKYPLECGKWHLSKKFNTKIARYSYTMAWSGSQTQTPKHSYFIFRFNIKFVCINF